MARTRQCFNCMFFEATKDALALGTVNEANFRYNLDPSDPHFEFMCRRYPPQPDPVIRITRFPFVRPEDWCGEWAPKPTD